MYEGTYTNQFKKYYRQCMKRRYDIELLDNLIKMLANTGTVSQKYNPHILSETERALGMSPKT